MSLITFIVTPQGTDQCWKN